MKRLVLLIVMMFFGGVFANSYVKFWENGVEKTGHAFLTRGNLVAWEADVNIPGGVLRFSFYEDVDSSLTISPDDRLLDFFFMKDGSLGVDEPGDSSAVPDGIIYVDIGPLGFLPGNFILQAQDEDGSTSMIAFHVSEKVVQPIQISGSISIEGVLPPSPLYQNIIFGAMATNFQGFWMGETDQNGNFTIQHPQADTIFVFPLFEFSMGKKIVKLDTQITYVTSDPTPPANLVFPMYKGNAKIYGKIYDQYGNQINKWFAVEVQNNDLKLEKRWYYDGANPFELYMYCNGLNEVQLNLDKDLGMEEYLFPNFWNIPDYRFSLNDGDTVKRNITIFKADTAIYVKIYENGAHILTGEYFINAYADTLMIYNDIITSSHLTRIPVYSGERIYNIYVTKGDQNQLPPGYVLTPDLTFAQPGDTITINVYIPDGAISGIVNVQGGNYLPYAGEYYIFAEDVHTKNIYVKQVSNFYSYTLPLPNGTYKIWLDHYTHNPQTTHWLIENPIVDTVVVNNDTSYANFSLIYGSAEVKVILQGTTINMPFAYQVKEINRPNINAGYVMVYDTTFSYFLSPGDWLFNAPQIPGFNGSVEPTDTILSLTENDFYKEIYFKYTTPTSIEENEKIFSFRLHQNYPNPFNPTTVISFELPSTDRVSLIIYNVLGEEVLRVLDNQIVSAGIHKLTLNMERFSSGIYFYKLISSQGIKTRKMILMK